MSRAEIVRHNLEFPLPSLGTFDAVVSSFAIHHLVHERKRQLYEEVWDVVGMSGFSKPSALPPGGGPVEQASGRSHPVGVAP